MKKDKLKNSFESKYGNLYHKSSQLKVPPTQRKILLLMLEGETTLFDKAELVEKTIGSPYDFFKSRTFDVHLCYLRKAIKQYGYIISVSGVGKLKLEEIPNKQTS